MRILLAEDDFTSRRIMTRFLRRYGDVDIAVDGDEALTAFATSLGEDRGYDLICLDLMMPRIDGHTALKQIRDYEERHNVFGSRRVLVVVTTALDDPRSVLKAFKGNCDGYLVKPVTPDQLREKLGELGIRELNAPPLSQASP